MMNREMVSIEQTKQLAEIMYKEFISKISVKGIKWELEFITRTPPNLCFKQLSSSYKTRKFINGGYVAELPFIIRYKDKADSTNNILELSQVLYDIANYFDQERMNGFKVLDNLLPEGYEVESLQMTSTPSLDNGIENMIASFSATYKLVYRVKGEY